MRISRWARYAGLALAPIPILAVFLAGTPVGTRRDAPAVTPYRPVSGVTLIRLTHAVRAWPGPDRAAAR